MRLTCNVATLFDARLLHSNRLIFGAGKSRKDRFCLILRVADSSHFLTRGIIFNEAFGRRQILHALIVELNWSLLVLILLLIVEQFIKCRRLNFIT